ncbi:pentatricopeptide repeat-containing protein At5g66520-like [Musa acuminata AAA Group]|uniref:(wild Malaysian banana) hypothetical protein n=1 Tax=Musa acuminata subsp. malaccensis TaxID=214687 RepID=A0A804IJF0_MUSAM|nr:PREDICTED: pentatricopeptide repeat-containing protein At5g66520-like [Musa acuminata subsp. malaccensis]XP_018679757.1 PREDICTED: pentatricopeptide repeat-containing protein At5g66520-like [Musa acuminata subsp. malaccensis]XP_018679758.1 PREDICTED: pentatricopeptide repeat-containing protein At5g66520-like [Musa acuminata subsp. malaccensis]CAG1840786.1 unnamed protein product [Musa acuminata subsp. malaccensis]
MLSLSSLASWKPYSRDLQQHLFLMLQGCKSMKQLTQLHAKLVVNGFSCKNVLITKLLSCCIVSGNITYASLAFDQVEEPNTTLCNQMIRAIFHGDMPESSFTIYNWMRRRGRTDTLQPNGFTYTFLLAACAKAGPNFLPQGEQLHCRIISGGFDSSVYIQTNLINMYAASATMRGESIAKAHKIFEEMPRRNIVSWNTMLAGYLQSGDVPTAFRFFDDMPAKDKVSWTTMIAGCAQAGMSGQALTLFSQMRISRVKPDQVTMIAVLSACAYLGDLELGRWIHAHVCNFWHGRECLVNLSNALIHMYVKCGAIDDAFQVFTEMPRKSTVTWTTMIAGLATHGYGDQALDLFQRMQCKGSENEKPDWLTFIAVLCACSYTGRIDKGLCYFEQMISMYGIRPKIQHYGCIVDMLSRAGHLNKAQELIKMMPVEPNSAIWGALLGGCWIHKDDKLAGQVIHRIMELEPDQVAGHLVSVSNLYVASMKRGDSQMFRDMMLELGIRKPAACSLIYANGSNS